MIKIKPHFFSLKNKKLNVFLIILILCSVIFISSFNFVQSTVYPMQNILVPEINPLETQDGSYGTMQNNSMYGIGYLLPSDTNGSGYWYINKVVARFSTGSENTLLKAVILDENHTIVAISNIFVSSNTSLLWNEFTFNVSPQMEPNKYYYFGLICNTGSAFYLHVKMNAYGQYKDFYDISNDFINPTNPTDGTFYSTGEYSIYVVISNFSPKSYNYVYEPNSINSGTGSIWAYDYPDETYGVNVYCPIGVPIVYTGNTFVGGLKTGNGTVTVYKTSQSNSANQWQVGTYTEVGNGTLTNGVFTLQFSAHSSAGYEGVQIIINVTIPELLNPIYTIHHNFKWGADNNGNIPTVQPTLGGSGGVYGGLGSVYSVLSTIFGNIYTDLVFVIFGIICGLLTWKFAMTGLIAGIGISTLLCAMAGIMPIWGIGLCIILDITLIILGSGLLNKKPEVPT